jgi:hypothetical protein
MKSGSAFKRLSRYTEISELSDKVRRVLKGTSLPMNAVLAIASLYLMLLERPGAGAFAMMCLGTSIALSVWSAGGVGLPLLPMIVIQNLLIYGVPIAVGHEIVASYPPEFVTSAGIEVLIFDAALVIGWKMGMQIFRPSPPVSHVLQQFNRAGMKGWARIGFALIIGATGFQILQGMSFAEGLFDLLPNGANSIIYAVVSVVSACGFFLVSMMIGSNEASVFERAIFWCLLIVNGMISASDFILAAAAANLITVAIGFFWSNGRVPARYLVIAMLTLSFLNTGKTTMRERYWGNDYEPAAQRTLVQLPSYFAEWVQVSFDAVLENHSDRPAAQQGAGSQANKNQTLLDRIDNLQNLLFVIDAIDIGHVKPLHGATYALIPPLLVPRVFWPDKPRSHEGQVLLNVHFGRQDLDSTFATYIAWGLLPEAYGNFGAFAGSIILGTFLGFLFAWIENYTARKLVMSVEGFLSLSLLMNLMNSFEMVASVLVTSTFQSFMIIVAASMPFVQKSAGRPTTEDESK